MSFFSTTISSPIGNLRALADADFLYLLEFEDSKELEKKIGKIISSSKRKIIQEENPILIKTKQELHEYFEGKRKNFEIPLQPLGTEFQQKSWEALRDIPF